MVVEPAVDDATEDTGAAPLAARGSYCRKMPLSCVSTLMRRLPWRGPTHLGERWFAQEVHRSLEEVDEVILELRERVLHVQGVEVLVQSFAARDVQELCFRRFKRLMEPGHLVNPRGAAGRTS